ncbi:GNAT family N-acetyltransferase [Mycobacterium sp. RTGN3]|uniref:GNAT family N-acetyltransferase n=1 Tax=unclassified Mycobacterium TaxID=2642494 RepID=UPI0039AF8D4B
MDSPRRAPFPEVVPRQPDDLRKCVDLLRSVHLANSYPISWPSDPARWLAPPKQIAAWVVHDAIPNVRGHVALHEVASHAARDIWTTASGVQCEHLMVLSRLIVSPSYRRYGLAEALVTAATHYAHRHGALPVLDVAQDNVAAIRLYEKLGWRRVGELEIAASRMISVFAYLGPVADDAASSEVFGVPSRPRGLSAYARTLRPSYPRGKRERLGPPQQ